MITLLLSHDEDGCIGQVETLLRVQIDVVLWSNGSIYLYCFANFRSVSLEFYTIITCINSIFRENCGTSLTVNFLPLKLLFAYLTLLKLCPLIINLCTFWIILLLTRLKSYKKFDEKKNKDKIVNVGWKIYFKIYVT